jgi:hypothetical protein
MANNKFFPIIFTPLIPPTEGGIILSLYSSLLRGELSSYLVPLSEGGLGGKKKLRGGAAIPSQAILLAYQPLPLYPPSPFKERGDDFI